MSEAFARRYKLLERIAVGGTAEVFHAIFVGEHGDQTPVVIKRVLPQMARDDRFRRLFQEEARIAAALAHPNIVKVLDFGVLGETCYIALEPVEGRDLGRLMDAARQSGELPPPTLAADIAAQVGRALQFIHGQINAEGLPLNIIHRDVSPQNILVSYRGDVKLTDFGIAKSALREDHTADGTVRGKPDYMSPEQALAGMVDHRADLFCLGCVLFEMLHGRPPFRVAGESEVEQLERVSTARLVVSPAELDAPQPLRGVVQRLLRPRPEDRFQSAGELVRELEAFLAASPGPHGRKALAGWCMGLRSSSAANVAERVVDDAVRALLGDAADGATDGGRPLPMVTDSQVRWPNERRSPQTAQVPTVSSGPTPHPELLDALVPQRQPELRRLVKERTAQMAHDTPAPVVAPTALTPLAEPGVRPRDRSPRALREQTAQMSVSGVLERRDVVPTPTGRLGPEFPTAEVTRNPPRGGRRWPLIVAAAVMAAAAVVALLLLQVPEQRPVAGTTKAVDSGRQPARADAGRSAKTWVRSTPAGAKILVDGAARGVTPLQLELPRQRFTLELRRRGYRPTRRRFDGPPAEGGEIHLVLAPISIPRKGPRRKTARLSVNSLPYSRVYIDNRYVGNTPLVKHRLRPGKHRVQLRSPGGKVRTTFVVRLRRGAKVTRHFDFQK